MNSLGSFFSIAVGILFVYFSSLGFGAVYDFIFLLGAGFSVYGFMAQLINLLMILKSRGSKHR